MSRVDEKGTEAMHLGSFPPSLFRPQDGQL
jgi:hypothetical protein